MRAFIADDEPLARDRLRALISEIEWLNYIGEAENGAAAAAAIDALGPDLVFLDVQMPGLTGLQVLESIRHQPAVIFTTAYSEYAVQAFELEALDYLLKPFGRERFRAAVERARRFCSGTGNYPMLARLRHALHAPARPARVLIRERADIVPVLINDIERLEAQDDYVGVIVAGRCHLLHLSLTDFHRRLDPETFVRIHRSHVVNLHHVARIVPFGDARLQVEMHNGTKIIASRVGSQRLRALTL